MRMRRIGWRFGLVGVGLLVSLATAVLAAMSSPLGAYFHRSHPLGQTATAPVRRTDLNVSLTTGGRIDSSNRTIIECRLERLEVGVRGKSMATGGASTILSIIPDGTPVKEGDVLCVLDASDYEELLITQRINLERVRADYRQAKLNLEVAGTSVQEYREGLMRQALKTLEGRIALTESDLERSTNRLKWARKMREKGYIPGSVLSSEEYQEKRLELDLTKGQTALRMFKQFGSPIYLRILESEVVGAEAFLNYQGRRLERTEERLAYLQKQIDRCTIRAPHDGFVIYANEEMKSIQIEPGLSVHQKQRLFYLPDLARMEVAAMLHESVVKDVKAGQSARVKIEAMGGRLLEGHVVSISHLPIIHPFSDVKYFVGTVKLDTIPMGLKPGMSAEVEIQTVRRPDVLAVPSEALTSEGGHDVCYVAVDDHLERREVTVGQSTRDMLEVTDGLDEGDMVVLDPTHIDSTVEIAAANDDDVPEPAPAGAQ